MNTRLGVAKSQSFRNFSEFDSSSGVHRLLTDLIEVNAKGFRGVVITALTGMHLNDNYDPLNNFYGCNPRSIFEGGIWYALQENGIPCGKSDPLNVAKNINHLDEAWATGRRPQSAALAAVNFLRLIVKANKSRRARLIDYFFFRLWKYSESIASFKLATVDSSSTSRYRVANALVKFTLKYPESGMTPQLLVSSLLSAVYRDTQVHVHGGGESVFGTNTTSKKPADIWLVSGEQETNLYEVTVKPITLKRLDDSIDALRSTGHLDKSVTFVCRIPEDIAALDVNDEVVVYKGKEFGVIDYRSLCLSVCALLTNETLEDVFSGIAVEMANVNVSLKTKNGWNEFFGT